MVKKRGSKGGAKGAKVKKAKPLVDGLKIEEMSRPQLYGHCKRLQDEILKELDERNKYMLEKERYYLLWQLLMERVDAQKDKLDLLKSHMEDTMKEKDAQEAVYDQKLRFLKSEQSKKLGEVRLFHLEKMKMVQDDAWNLQMIMRDSLLAKKSAIRRAQMSLFEIIQCLHLQHGKDLSEMRRKFGHELNVLEAAYNRRLHYINDRENEGQEDALNQLVTNKEDQLKTMFYSHELQMKDMKTFFNELTLNNLSLVAKMEIEMRQNKEGETRMKRQKEALEQALAAVVDPINDCNKKIQEWEETDQEFDKLKLQDELKALKKTKAQLKRKSRLMEYANEALIQRITISEKERDELRRRFSHAIVDMQRKTSMRRLVMALQRKAARRETELFESVSNTLDQPEGGVDHYKILMDRRDKELKSVMEQVVDAATDHKTTYDIYAAAYQNNVIPFEEIGFPLLKTGVKPREEEERPMMIYDTTATKKTRHRHFPGLPSVLTRDEGGGGSVRSEDTSMTSSQTTSELPSQMGKYDRGEAPAGSTTKSTKSAKLGAQLNSRASAVNAGGFSKKSLSTINEKIIEHVRRRQSLNKHLLEGKPDAKDGVKKSF